MYQAIICLSRCLSATATGGKEASVLILVVDVCPPRSVRPQIYVVIRVVEADPLHAHPRVAVGQAFEPPILVARLKDQSPVVFVAQPRAPDGGRLEVAHPCVRPPILLHKHLQLPLRKVHRQRLRVHCEVHLLHASVQRHVRVCRFLSADRHQPFAHVETRRQQHLIAPPLGVDLHRIHPRHLQPHLLVRQPQAVIHVRHGGVERRRSVVHLHPVEAIHILHRHQRRPSAVRVAMHHRIGQPLARLRVQHVERYLDLPLSAQLHIGLRQPFPSHSHLECPHTVRPHGRLIYLSFCRHRTHDHRSRNPSFHLSSFGIGAKDNLRRRRLLPLRYVSSTKA